MAEKSKTETETKRYCLTRGNHYEWIDKTLTKLTVGSTVPMTAKRYKGLKDRFEPA